MRHLLTSFYTAASPFATPTPMPMEENDAKLPQAYTERHQQPMNSRLTKKAIPAFERLEVYIVQLIAER